MKRHYRKMKIVFSVIVILVFLLANFAMTWLRAEAIRNEQESIINDLQGQVEEIRYSENLASGLNLSDDDRIDAYQTYVEVLTRATYEDISFYGEIQKNDGTILAQTGQYVVLSCYDSLASRFENDDRLFRKVLDLNEIFTETEMMRFAKATSQNTGGSFLRITGNTEGLFIQPNRITLYSSDYTTTKSYDLLVEKLGKLFEVYGGEIKNPILENDVTVTLFSNSSQQKIELHWDGESLTPISQQDWPVDQSYSIIGTPALKDRQLYLIDSFDFSTEFSASSQNLTTLANQDAIYEMDKTMLDMMFINTSFFQSLPAYIAEAKASNDKMIQQNQRGFFPTNGVDELTRLFTLKYQSFVSVNDLNFPYTFISHPFADAANELLAIYIFSALLLFFVLNTITMLLDKTRRQQEQLDNSRRQLTRAIAHELKTPLGIISSYSEGLLEPLAPEQQADYARVIVEETRNMDALILDMLELSRLEAGARHLQTEEIDLVQLAGSVLKRFEPIMMTEQISWYLDAPGEVLIDGDLKGLMTVLANFISNAIKHTNAGQSITVRISLTDKQVLTEVINQGQPIAPEQINRIWDSFYKGDEARSHCLGSSGLGLSIAKSILELHHDQFGCTNIAGGVCFWFKHQQKRSKMQL